MNHLRLLLLCSPEHRFLIQALAIEIGVLWQLRVLLDVLDHHKVAFLNGAAHNLTKMSMVETVPKTADKLVGALGTFFDGLIDNLAWLVGQDPMVLGVASDGRHTQQLRMPEMLKHDSERVVSCHGNCENWVNELCR